MGPRICGKRAQVKTLDNLAHDVPPMSDQAPAIA
jgi:hypothetical protein